VDRERSVPTIAHRENGHGNSVFAGSQTVV